MEIELRFYVYILKRPNGVQFYVGMGSGNRIDEHEMFARNGDKTHKSHIIRKIWASGETVRREIVGRFATDTEAKEVEKEFIAAIGRKDLKAGPLVNRTNGGDGVTGWSAEMRARHSVLTSKGMSRPEVQQKVRENIKRQFSQPDISEKMSRAEYWKSHENRAQQSIRIKKYFADPKVREEHAKRQKAMANRPETKEKHRLAAAARWKKPGFAEKRRATYAAKRAAKLAANALF